MFSELYRGIRVSVCFRIQGAGCCPWHAARLWKSHFDWASSVAVFASDGSFMLQAPSRN